MVQTAITLLFFSGCPNTSETEQLINEIIEEYQLRDTKFEIVKVDDQKEAEKYNFLGSPTVQINGLDIERKRREDKPFFGCRLYQIGRGSSGTPPKELLLDALKEQGII